VAIQTNATITVAPTPATTMPAIKPTIALGSGSVSPQSIPINPQIKDAVKNAENVLSTCGYLLK